MEGGFEELRACIRGMFEKEIRRKKSQAEAKSRKKKQRGIGSWRIWLHLLTMISQQGRRGQVLNQWVMKLISWNVRGMNSPSKRAAIKGFIKSMKGELVFLLETKMEVIDSQVICSIFVFHEADFVYGPSEEASGVILLLRNSTLSKKLDVYVGSYSVSTIVRGMCKGVEWVATSIYGPVSSSDLGEFCSKLNTVAGKWNRPWVVGGDFNVIRFSNERKVGCPISNAMWGFSDWIRHRELVDLPLGGAKYTWSNLQTDLAMNCLDQFLVSADWMDLFRDWSESFI